jgi:conjugal transfer pilus assembly protein TraE
MKLRLFRWHWDSTRQANVLLSLVVLMLVIAVIVLSGRLATLHERVALIPPRLNHQVVLGYDSASSSYYKAWGLYAAELVGNMTPRDAPFVSKHMQLLVAPNIYPLVNQDIMAEKLQEQQDNVVTSFDAHQVIWQRPTRTVFVTGTQHQIASNGNYVSGNQLTYQVDIRIHGGQPVITDFQVYPGAPHILKWIIAHPNYGKTTTPGGQ